MRIGMSKMCMWLNNSIKFVYQNVLISMFIWICRMDLDLDTSISIRYENT